MLKKTTEGGFVKPHHHIVYLSTLQGTGFCSVHEQHEHQIIYQPPTPGAPEQVDEMGNVVAPAQPPTPEAWILAPAADGHTHEPEEYIPKDIEEKQDAAEVHSDCMELFREWSRLERDSIEAGRLSEKFAQGDQWDHQLKSYLEAQSRAALTFNKIEKNIDDLVGYQRQNRTDIHYTPTEGSDQVVCDILNIVSKNILENCDFALEESMLFEDSVIAGRGVVDITVDTSKNPLGDIKVSSFQWDGIHFGPHAKRDLSDCDGYVKHKLFSVAKLKQLFPDKTKEIDEAFSSYRLNESSDIEMTNDQGIDENGTESVSRIVGTEEMVSISRKELRLLEVWRRKYLNVNVVVYPKEDFFFSTKGWTPADVAQVKTIPGMYVIPRIITEMRVTKIVGNQVLSDENPADLPEPDFYTFPLYARRKRGRFKGKVESAIDAQKQLNQRRSQMIDIGNKCAAYGWFISPGMFADELEEQKFLDNSSSPGFVAKLTNMNMQPQKVEGIKFPNEVVQLMALDEQTIAEMLTVSVSPSGANQSAEHFSEAQKARLTSIEFLFDNLSFVKKLIGRRLVPLIQRYYSPQRIIRILRAQSRQAPVNLPMGPNGEPQSLDEISDEEIIHLLTTQDLTKADVTISESSYSPSRRLTTFSILKEMQQAGAPIPWDVLLGLIDMPEKERLKVMTSMQQQQEQMAAASAGTQESEVVKSLIGQGMIPPKIAEQYGLSQPPGLAAQQPPGTEGPPPPGI